MLVSGMPTARPRGPRPRRGAPDATRARLVAAAATIFNRQGYHHTDSNRIARAAGYAPGTFYKHFADKRAIFLAVYDAWVTAEWAELGTRLATTTDAPATIVDLTIRYHRRWRGFRASLHSLVATDPLVRRAYRQQRKRQLAQIALLRAGMGLDPTPAAQGALVLFMLERTCDAIAQGEAKTLGLSPTALAAALTRAVAEQLA
jgi:AcrR family transcriptional regulator